MWTVPSQAEDNKLHFKAREPHPASAWPARRAESLRMMEAYSAPYVTDTKSSSSLWAMPRGFSVQSTQRYQTAAGISTTALRAWDLHHDTQASLLSDGAGWGLGIKSADSNQKQLELIERVKKVYNPNNSHNTEHAFQDDGPHSWNRTKSFVLSFLLKLMQFNVTFMQ